MILRFPRYLRDSVRGRLTLLVAVVMAPTASLAAVLILQAYRNEHDAVERHLAATARSFSVQVDHQFLEREALLKALVGSPALEHEDWRPFYDQAKAIAMTDDQWVVLIDADGQQIVNTSQPFGAPLPKVAFRPEFREAAERGRTYISNLVTGPARKHYLAFIAIPIFRQGALRYTLNFAMYPGRLSPWLQSGEAPADWIVSLLDREGVIAARNHSPDTYVGGKARENVLRAIQAPADDATLGGKTLEGIEVLTAFSRCQQAGWSVAVGAPKSELYSSAQHLLYLAIAVSAISFILLASMAIWVARGLSRAVGALVSDAEALGAGTALSRSKSDLHEIDVVGESLRTAGLKLASRESDLKQLNESLDARVQERTRELANANRELENFARIASHDLKEPLRLMTAYAGILRAEYHDQLDEAGRMYLERIEASAERQRALINDILNYSRVLNLPTPKERVDLMAVLAAVKDDLEIRIRETAGKIEVGALGEIQGDPVQLHQLLLNLLGNSLKFHRPGIPPIVQVSSFEKEGWLHLIVEDNGIGFEPRYAEKIFSPFERLHSGKTYEGTGMGLTIVRMIAERHGGTVRAESEPGRGSRFETILRVKPDGATT